MAGLKLKNIQKVYDNGFEAVKDFNLDINPGEPKGIIDCRDRPRASGRAVRCQKE